MIYVDSYHQSLFGTIVLILLIAIDVDHALAIGRAPRADTTASEKQKPNNPP